MKPRTQLYLAWLAFVLVIAAAIAVGEFGSRFEWYIGAVVLLGAVSLIPAAWVLARSHFDRGSVLVVVLGVAASQWRTLQMLYLVMSWEVHGFVR